MENIIEFNKISNNNNDSVISSSKNLKDNIIKYFNSLRHEFDIKIFNKYLDDEINFLKKNRLIDNNTMFNYLYLYNYYKNLIYNYKEFNIFFFYDKNDNIKSYNELINKIMGINLNLKDTYSQIIFEQYFDKNSNDLNNIHYILYESEYNSFKKINDSLLETKDILDIKKYLEQNNNNNNTKSYIISLLNNNNKIKEEDIILKINYIFINTLNWINSDYKSFKNYMNEQYLLINENYLKEYNTYIDKIFENKKNFSTDGYFSRYISSRKITLLKNINVFITENENKFIINDFLYDNLNKENDVVYKDINFNNCFYINSKNTNNNKNSNNNSKNNLEILNDLSKEMFISKIFKYLKNEINFYKNTLHNFFILTNDNLNLSINSSFNIPSPDFIFYYENSFQNLIKSKKENYVEKKIQIKNDFHTNIENFSNEELNKIKSIFDNKFLIKENDKNNLIDYFKNLYFEIKDKANTFLKEIDSLNLELFSELNKILSLHGISCKNFNDFIININNNISMSQNIESLKNEQNNLDEFKNFLKMSGVSGVLGIAGGFVFNRVISTVGSQVSGGMIGGPPGMIVGGIIGIGSLFGQSIYHFKNNRNKIEKLFEDLKKSAIMSMEFTRKNAENLIKNNEQNIKEKIEDVEEYMKILINRAIMSKANY